MMRIFGLKQEMGICCVFDVIRTHDASELRNCILDFDSYVTDSHL